MPLPASQANVSQLTLVLDRFDAAWQGDEPPALGSFLDSDSSPLQRRELLLELIPIDLEYRWRKWGSRGETQSGSNTTSESNGLPLTPSMSDYCRCFPDLGLLSNLPSTLIAQEYRVRRQWGDWRGPAEFEVAYPSLIAKFGELIASVDRDLSVECDARNSTVDPRPGIASDTSLRGSGVISENDDTLPADPATSTEPKTRTQSQFFGDYELLNEIARGGMGVVYRARQSKLNRIVALKMILAGNFATPDDVKRFYTEAEAAAKLDHPGIVPIYEVGEHAGQHFFSMGFVEGQSLSERLRNGPLPPTQSAELMQRISIAIAYAHSRGVIHRDLKPANVLLDRYGTPKVTDFGLAKNLESDSGLTRSGSVMGTPSFMPPEQASGNTSQVGPLADLYSLGAMLYCLLTGRPPFQAATAVDTLMQVMVAEPVSPRQLNPQVPKDLETICLKCLEKDSARRYGSADDLVSELTRFLRGEPILATPIGAVSRGWRWCMRNRILAGSASAVAATLLIIAIVASDSAILINEARNDELLAKQQHQRALTELRSVNQTALYALDLNQIARRIQSDEYELAHRILSEVSPDLRNCEWCVLAKLSFLDECIDDSGKYKNWRLARASTKELPQVVTAHSGIVRALAFNESGTLLASAGDDCVIRVWNTTDWSLRCTLEGHQAPVFAIVFFPTSETICSSSADKTVRLWSFDSRSELTRLESDEGLQYQCLAISEDGKRLWAGGGGEMLLARSKSRIRVRMEELRAGILRRLGKPLRSQFRVS